MSMVLNLSHCPVAYSFDNDFTKITITPTKNRRGNCQKKIVVVGTVDIGKIF